MAKIRLEMADLTVESFSTAAADRRAAGTVRGLEYTNEPCTSLRDCPSVYTGHEGCPGCHVSGNLSCVGCPYDTGSCDPSCGATDGGSICLEPYC
jgi:hypothetical protein